MGPSNGERATSPEYEQIPASIRLEFFRHDEKGKGATSGDRTGDEFVRLTPKGRVNATAAGKPKNPHPEVAIAFGSPRERSMESGMRQMLTNEDAITPDSTLEEIRAFVDQQLKVGKKDKVLTELNFDWDSHTEFHNLAYQRHGVTKDQLAFLYHDSDALVKKNKDSLSTAYSRVAARFANIIRKYVGILPRWERIIKDNPEKYGHLSNQMERYFGTHAATIEPFLMKVIEKTQGPEDVEEFLKTKKGGFDPSEGYTITIQKTQDQPQVTLTYAGNTYQISPQMLQEIIQEGDELEKAIQETT